MSLAIEASPTEAISLDITDDEFERIGAMVYRHCRIRLGEGKRALIRARLAKCLRESGVHDVGAYLAHVAADKTGREFSRLIDSISTNLTSFFRERNHFIYLEKQVLPKMFEAKRAAHSNRIRIWSAGCSTGEEPYSLAMMMLEALAGREGWDVKILGTDISRRVLRIAKAGSFDPAHVRLAPEPFRGKYFRPARRTGEAGGYVVPEVRDLVTFRYLNLIDSWPFKGPFDFIFCRNVMIYFDADTQQNLVNRFWEVLAPGGHLMTGHSESLNGMTHKFKYVEPTVYRKELA